MARSSTTIPATAASHGEGFRVSSNPQPFSSPTRAGPTAAVGKSSRTRTVFSTTTPRLAAQRPVLGTVSFRRGMASSHRATEAKTPKKNPRRMNFSCSSSICSTMQASPCLIYIRLIFIRPSVDSLFFTQASRFFDSPSRFGER
uniref:Uncharacterized protein n=1 Tax=Candidatus Kentrum sp. LFY TaxID=2126342 RepID=A0A450VA70_9GAMM|nr:MAG: hypothetical protein BECKLFY1418A_GA0070994_11566 [Candidatus Kentron sp. LFY]